MFYKGWLSFTKLFGYVQFTVYVYRSIRGDILHFNHPRVSAVNLMATRTFREREKNNQQQQQSRFIGCIHLQYTCIAVAFAHWNCLLFLNSKAIKLLAGKCDGYTRPLQMNAPFLSTKILKSILTWITEKELEWEIKNKGDQFRWKENVKKFYSGSEKMKNVSGHQSENQRLWKKRSEQEHIYTTLPS